MRALKVFSVTVALFVAGFVTPAAAGIYSDDLSKCLVKNSSETDQITLVKWIFSAIAAHPAVRPFANLTPDQSLTMAKDTSAIFERLMLKDCRSESVAALKYEGSSAVESGFSTLGQVAMRSIFNDPNVAANLANFSALRNAEGFNQLYKDAGVTPPTNASQ